MILLITYIYLNKKLKNCAFHILIFFYQNEKYFLELSFIYLYYKYIKISKNGPPMMKLEK